MDYYKLLQLDREPFSNSPDPEYFFQSRQHLGCLQKLELALRLKRGLNVVIGDVGTGKTTLCRQLIRRFSKDNEFESHLILDPSFPSHHEFLIHIHALICGHQADAGATDVDLKEKIKQTLFSKGVDRSKTIVLIVDEGQKITAPCVEILREFLNYETNTYKLLQIVIFAQLEFEQILEEHSNFSDRINVLHHLQPMDFKDTRQMVTHRLKLSSSSPKPRKFFTFPAMWAIYRASRGYPRKIIHICHQSMLAMIIQNRSRAGWSLIQSCKRRIAPGYRVYRKSLLAGLTVIVTTLVLVVYAQRAGNQQDMRTKENAFKIYRQAALSPSMTEKPASPEAHAPAPTNGTDADSADINARPHPPLDISTADNPSSADTFSSVESPEHLVEQDDAEPEVISPAPSLPPASLGKLIVRPGDTLMRMIKRVYGTFQPRHMRAILESNSHIKDPNRIDIGDIIQFPTLQIGYQPQDTSNYWVVLEKFQTLPAAMQRAHEITKEIRIPLQLMATWSQPTGLQFQLLVKGHFSAAHEAANYLQALPEEVSAQSHVLSEWPQDMILYSDPYGSGSH